MVNSSPEYLITKPGLLHLRKREKPLKTYGRRTSSTPEARSEPASKRPRLASVEAQHGPLIPSRDDVEAPKPNPSVEHKAKEELPASAKKDEAGAKKGSIMNYFKPKTPKSQDTPPCQPRESLSSEPTPPSSPVREIHLKRKPRLLKIRALPNSSDGHTDASENEDENGQIGPGHSGEGSEDDGNEEAERDPSNNGDDIPSPRRDNRRVKETIRSGLTKHRSSPGIQTTLNISTQAAFSECKVCDTVWNPLYPDDVKYHTKRHKAVLRTQNRKLDDL